MDFKGNDCVVCHGGNPNIDDKNVSHSGILKNVLKSENLINITLYSKK